jgi:hypothetical protein
MRCALSERTGKSCILRYQEMCDVLIDRVPPLIEHESPSSERSAIEHLLEGSSIYTVEWSRQMSMKGVFSA